MNPSDDQKLALDAMDSGRSVFLTGDAGTGKSATIREFIKRNKGKRIARLASTAAAAQLIRGETVHRFFKLKPELYVPFSFRNDDELVRKIRNFDTIIIDEVSMLRIDVFQAVRDRLFAAAKGIGPFAGYQVITVGDFSQLPPVVTQNEEEFLKELYGDNQVFAFQSQFWSNFEHINLTQNHRQSKDARFGAWLAQVRRGKVPDVAVLNERVSPPAEGTTHLVTTVRAAEEINKRQAEKLPPGSYKLEGKIQGQFQPKNMRVPQLMRLKPGSRVIICANNAEKGYFNGNAGILVKCRRDDKGNPKAVVRLDNGSTVSVEQAVWEDIRYGRDRRDALQADTVGKFTQLPLLPGWAITIHRSQGMSIDNLHVDLRGVFAPGQAYVALSRATSLEGLTLAAPIQESDFRFDDRVTEFMRNNFDLKTDEASEQPVITA